MSSSTIVALIYLFITVTCVAVSGLSTYYGFEALLKDLTLPVTAVIVAGLLASDLAILSARQKGESIAGAVFVLLLFTAASAASNFNYFYTNFMRNDVVSDRMTLAAERFVQNARAAENALRPRTSGPQQQIDAINEDMRRLTDEVRDPANQGFGNKARVVLDRLLASTGIQPPKTPTGASKEVNEQALATIESRVAQKVQELRGKDPVMRVLLAIETKRKAQDDLLQQLRDPNNNADFGSKISAIEQWRGDTVDIQGQSNALLGAGQTLTLEPVLATGIELNSIPNTIRSGFVERPNTYVTVLAALTAVMIDIVPLLVALFLVRKSRSGSTRDDGGSKRSRKFPEILAGG